MGSFKTIFFAGLVAATSTAAFSADLLPPPPDLAPLPPPALEVGDGWYLRGDIGVSSYHSGKFSSPDLPPALFYGENFGSGGFGGVGVGYQFNSWLRADVTGEYRFSTGVKVYDKIEYQVGYLKGTTREVNEGDFSSKVVLLNGYFDLGTWNGVTPFVGAGVGFASNRLESFTDKSLNEFPIGGAVFSSGGTYREGEKTNLAWALHAGLAYDVTPNFKVELAYRYLHLGDARTGVLNCYCGETYSAIKVKNLESHDFKIAMRWMLNAPPPPATPIAPIMAKY